jgi:hypothetical protein
MSGDFAVTVGARRWLLFAGVLAILSGCATAPDRDAAEARACGGLQGAACGAGAYCAYEQTGQCGSADQTGMCMPRPEACTMEFNPVCGCNATTYSNACMAAAEGVSVAHLGECL